MKIAAQLYTVRDYLKTEKDIAESLKKVKQTGYDAVQLSGLGKCDPAWLANQLRGNGLTVCATHTPYERLVSETDDVIAENLLYGNKYVGLGYYIADNADGYKAAAEKLAAVAEKVHDAGMRFVYHNHRHEFTRAFGERPIDIILGASNKIGLLADLFWAQAAGFNPAQFVRENADRIDVVHFKDMGIDEKERLVFCEVFGGNMDYGSIYEACAETGVEWAAVEQDVCPGDPFVSLDISLKNLRAHGMA